MQKADDYLPSKMPPYVGLFDADVAFVITIKTVNDSCGMNDVKS